MSKCYDQPGLGTDLDGFLSSYKHWNYGEEFGWLSDSSEKLLVNKANLPVRPPIDLSCAILPANQWVYAACTSRFQVVKHSTFGSMANSFKMYMKSTSNWVIITLHAIKLKETLANEINSLEGISVDLQSGFAYKNNKRRGVSIYFYQSSNPNSLQNPKLFSFYEVVLGLSCSSITFHVKKQTGKGTSRTGISTSATGDSLKPFQTSVARFSGLQKPHTSGCRIGELRDCLPISSAHWAKISNIVHASARRELYYTLKVKKRETCISWWQPPTSFWRYWRYQKGFKGCTV